MLEDLDKNSSIGLWEQLKDSQLRYNSILGELERVLNKEFYNYKLLLII